MFYIYLGVLTVSIIVVSLSIYGMGKNDTDKNSGEYIASSVFFNISMITLLISLTLIIKDSQASKFCSMNNILKKNPKISLESIVDTLVDTAEKSVKSVVSKSVS